MAASKTLAAAFAVALLALLTLTAAAPTTDAAAADDATAAYETLHIEGISGAAEAPALDGLAVRSGYDRCRSYFVCGDKKVRVPVKHSYPCYYKEAPSSFKTPRGGGLCKDYPYNCNPATCIGWRQCTCDSCQTVTFTQTVWCEK